jgi:hypothetical protein
MKALTDKIIDDLMDEKKEHRGGLYNAAFNDGLTYAISTIIELTKEAEFEEVARVMMKHLADPKKYHPHHRVVIDSTNAELLEGVCSSGNVMDYIKD